jgi:hypothetical protein
LFTHSLDHLECKFGAAVGEEVRERDAYYLGEEFLYCLVYYLGIVLAIYIKEVFAGFSPPRGFPRINDVSLVIVLLLVILSMLWLSSKLKINLIIA